MKILRDPATILGNKCWLDKTKCAHSLPLRKILHASARLGRQHSSLIKIFKTDGVCTHCVNFFYLRKDVCAVRGHSHPFMTETLRNGLRTLASNQCRYNNTHCMKILESSRKLDAPLWFHSTLKYREREEHLELRIHVGVYICLFCLVQHTNLRL